jgi:hypothetical protein
MYFLASLQAIVEVMLTTPPRARQSMLENDMLAIYLA